MERPNPNLEAAIEAYAAGMPYREITRQFNITAMTLVRGLKARGDPLRREKKEPIRQEAVAAYRAGEFALSIQARLGVPNMTLYNRLSKLGIERRIAPKTKPTCWACGERVPHKGHKTCGKPECQRKAGVPMPWSKAEQSVLVSGIVAGTPTKAIAMDLPHRTILAIEYRIRKTKRAMRKAKRTELARAA